MSFFFFMLKYSNVVLYFFKNLSSGKRDKKYALQEEQPKYFFSEKINKKFKISLKYVE